MCRKPLPCTSPNGLAFSWWTLKNKIKGIVPVHMRSLGSAVTPLYRTFKDVKSLRLMRLLWATYLKVLEIYVSTFHDEPPHEQGWFGSYLARTYRNIKFPKCQIWIFLSQFSSDKGQLHSYWYQKPVYFSAISCLRVYVCFKKEQKQRQRLIQKSCISISILVSSNSIWANVKLCDRKVLLPPSFS